MIDNNLLQGIVTAVISSATGAIVVFILPYIARLAARTINFWLIGIVLVVLVAGLLYGASLEKISLLWVFGGLFIIILSYGIYKRYFDFPFRKWRVNNNQSRDRLVTKVQRQNCGLLALQSGFDGIPIGKTWMFKANRTGWAVYGPYIASLGKGKYKAVFKIKVIVGAGLENEELKTPIGDINTKAIEIIKIDVASRNGDHGWGDIRHCQPEPLTTRSFTKANKYQRIPVEFRIKHEKDSAKGLELRIESSGNGHIVVLDYIKLSRRLF